MRIGVWYYSIDPDLRLIHAFQDCAALKMARKYNTHKEVKIADESDARKLDDLLEQGYRTCATCYNREQRLCALNKGKPRPGFKRPPRDWRPPVKRVSTRKRKSTTKE